MKGKALIAIKQPKSKLQFEYEQNPLGIIKGKTEELKCVSPRERKQENKIYLKSVSPNLPLIHRPQTNLEAVQSYLNETFSELGDHPNRKTHHKFHNPSQPVKFEKITTEALTRFTEHCHKVESEKFKDIDLKLFPEDLHERTAFVPDDRPTRLISSSFMNETTQKRDKERNLEKNRRADTSLLSYMQDSFDKSETINFRKIKENKYMPFQSQNESFQINEKALKRKSASLSIETNTKRDRIRLLVKTLLPQM
ncbi:unnamed protein product [Blepharisma stoltei]|uniref:Uncharacterized protein n=1 Tax=Blepharisma stoltei TaxID=1481888 RepID=A0AAU9JW60_9CILI|nr:unnamed protein product [Blepharisma stoltei]